MMGIHIATRIVFGILVVAFGFVITHFVTQTSDLLGVEDGLQFFLASVVFFNAWKPTVRFFLERPLNYGRFLSVAISCWSLSFMLASVWAVTWRSFGYSPTFSDTTLRFWFRYIAICGCVSCIAAPALYDEKPTRQKLGKLGAGFFGLVLTAILIVYGGRIRDRFVQETSLAPTVSYFSDDAKSR